MKPQLLAIIGLCILVLDARAADRLHVCGYGYDGVATFGAGDGAPLGTFAPGGLDGVLGAAVGPDGAIYVCSELSDSVLRFDGDSGAFLGVFIGDDPSTPGNEAGPLDEPSGILFGDDGHAYVASFALDSVLRYDARSGAFQGVFVSGGLGGLNGPDAGMAFGPTGELFIPSYFTNRIKRYAAADGAFLGDFATQASAGIVRPRMIAFPGDGFAYVVSEANDRVVLLDAATGAFVRNLVSDEPATPQNETGGLDAPSAVAFGPDGRVYVASLATNAVLRYERVSGAFVDAFVPSGAQGLLQPTFLLFRPDARVYGAPTPNSAGAGATLVAHGFASVAADQLSFELYFAPPGEACLLFAGVASADLPFGDGRLLVQPNPIARLCRAQADGLGRARFELDFAHAGGASVPFLPGTTRYVQARVRDLASAGAGFNTTTAVEVRLLP
jgi:DNA-binding beta-propeller fold protein YncE